MGMEEAEQERVLGQPALPGTASASSKKRVGWMFTNYIPLRRGLEEHARFGKGFGLTHDEGWAFVLILMRADCETGLWRGSAKSLLPYNWNHRQAKKILESLEKKGYIKRFCKPRQRGNYLIAVDKYGVTRGPHRGLIVDAKQSTSPESMFYRVSEEGPREGQLGAPSQEVRTEKKKEKEHTAQASPSLEFDRFWDAYPKGSRGYPRRVGKLPAQKAWNRIFGDKQTAPLRWKWQLKLRDEIMSALDLWKATEQWQKDGGQFIPYPATFLNQRRWEDDPPAREQSKDAAVGRGSQPAGKPLLFSPEVQEKLRERHRLDHISTLKDRLKEHGWSAEDKAKMRERVEELQKKAPVNP